MKKKEKIIELADTCKLVHRDSRTTGHDCWGNIEFESYDYVIIGNQCKEVFPDYYIIHDGKNVSEVLTQLGYQLRQQEESNLKKFGFKTMAEHKAYLKGKKEIKFPNDMEIEKATFPYTYDTFNKQDAFVGAVKWCIDYIKKHNK